MSDKKALYADEGMILTDGTTYGSIIYLAEGADEKNFYQISEEEYNEIANSEQAEESDYTEALERFGAT